VTELVTTRRVPCPDCGELATLIVRADYAVGGERVVEMRCESGCRPDEADLERLAAHL
jgi:hypothetical protein